MSSTPKSIPLPPAVSEIPEPSRVLIWLKRAFTGGWQFSPQEADPAEWWLAKSILASVLLVVALAANLFSKNLVQIVLTVTLMLVVAPPFLKQAFSSPLAHLGKLVFLGGSFLVFLTGLQLHFLGLSLSHKMLWPSPLAVTVLALVTLCWILSVESFFTAQNNRLMQKIKALRHRQSQLKIGDQVLIKAGELIPRDGLIIKGMSSVDESALSGSKRPVFKSKGDTVFAASINRDSEILIEITQETENDLIEKIFELQDQSLQSRPALEKNLIRYELAILILIAALFASRLAYLSFIQPLPFWQALSLSAPLLFLAPLGLLNLYHFLFDLIFFKSFEQRLIVKKSSDLEKLARIGCVFFNKTGTLTKGDFVYSQAFIERGTNMGEFLSAIFSLEIFSDHPLALAVETHPWYPEIARVPVRDFQSHAGLGVCGNIRLAGRRNETFAAVGNLRFLKRHRFNISRDMKFKVDELEEMGDTVVLVAFDRQIRGIMSFSDLLRKDIRKVLGRLQKLGLETSLITGDTEKTVTHVVGKLGIKKVYSRCTPEEKAAKIEKERENAVLVAMVAKDLDNQSAFEKADLSISFDTGLAFLNHPSDILILGRDIKLLSWLFEKVIVAGRLIKSQLLSHSGLFVLTATLSLFSLLPAVTAILASTGLALGVYPFVKKYLMLEMASRSQHGK